MTDGTRASDACVSSTRSGSMFGCASAIEGSMLFGLTITCVVA